MSEAFLGEIRCFGFTFTPAKWALCNGQLLSVQQYAPLFSIIGTNYGGNGTTNFALPNLQGSAPMNWGNGASLTPTVVGESLGSTTATVTLNELPAHNHTIHTFPVRLNPAGGTKTNAPSNAAYIGDSDPDSTYISTGTINTPLSSKAIGFGYPGNPQPHENMQPYLALNFCICIDGLFPSRG